MRIEDAKREAREVAKTECLRMVVTFNPYDEAIAYDRDEGYGFVPERAFHIFERHETIVELLNEAGEPIGVPA